MTAIHSKLSTRSPEFKAGQQVMAALVADLRDKVEIGGGEATARRWLMGRWSHE